MREVATERENQEKKKIIQNEGESKGSDNMETRKEKRR